MGVEYFYYAGPEYFKLIRSTNDLIMNYDKYKENGTIEEKKTALLKGATGFFKNYNQSIDKEIFKLLTAEYLLKIKHISKNSLPTYKIYTLLCP